MFEKTKALCNSFLDMGVPGFDLIVYHKGQCVLRYMGGFSDLENKIPVAGKEKYHIYSCSKPITCTAAMQLWEKGMFRLEDKLSDYMPEFADMTVQTKSGIQKAENPIRIHHLFEMTAGFSYDLHTKNLEDFRRETGGRCPTRELGKYLSRDPLCFEPGAHYQYSLCHDVLAALVELLSGQPFEDYVKAHIFDPLGMKHSNFLLPETQFDTLACQYRFDEDIEKPVRLSPENQYRLGSEHASGGAGCVSTVEDYIKFAEALRVGDVILKKETVQLMATDRLTPEQWKTFTLPDFGYGLGMRTPKAGGIRTDFGWGGAAGAYLAIDTNHDISLFYAQHLLKSPNRGARNNLFPFVLEDLLGIKAAPAVSDAAQKYDLTY